MAMVLDAFVSAFVDRLVAFLQEEVAVLLGLEEDLIRLKITLVDIKAVLADAEKKKMGEKIVHLWLSKLREVMYDADDIIDDCRLEAGKHRQQQPSTPGEGASSSSVTCNPFSFLSCFSTVGFRHEIGRRIAAVNAKLDEINKSRAGLRLESNTTPVDRATVREPSRDTSELIIESDIVGIDEDARDLVDRLTGGSGLICAIVGMGGIGKTTLAQKIVNDERIKAHFTIIWVCVKREYKEVDLLHEIITSAGGQCGGARTKAQLHPLLKRVVEDKRFLLVLDDVWDENIWADSLRCALHTDASDSKVLITTRKENVVRRMGEAYIHQMKLLPDEEGWSMLCKVFGEEKINQVLKLRDIGMQIVKKCKGLPLAIKAIRGVLEEKDPSEVEWRNVLLSQSWDFTELPADIIPALYLSYEDLPSHLKQCFIYCSLFPEDFKFHQPNLVQMWIAESFVSAKGGLAMEDVAEEYYMSLVKRNLLQPMPDYYDQLGCKMHDVVRALAIYVSRSEYLYRDAHGSDVGLVMPRHLTLVGGDASSAPEIHEKYEFLRTLLLSKSPSIKIIPSDFFDKLRRLRVLDLSYTGIGSLPHSLGGLIHLRFLNVSFTKIKELPESVQNLRNLQALMVNGCKFLRRFPCGVVQLHNLTHLIAGTTDIQLEHMPVGLGGLQNLRRLHGFVVNDDSGGQEDRSECNMKELKNLSQLQRLTMHKLERVVGKEEAEQAVLRNKKNLNYLRLSCTHRANCQKFEDDEIRKIEDVFEGLLPPSSLGALHIEGFFGHNFPSWVTQTSLSNLKWLRLDDCKLCRQLPPLGRLTQLRVLHVWGVSMVSTIGPEFLSGEKAFPKLQELYFWGMGKWKQWLKLEEGVLPSLKKLQITKCPKLKSLPEGLYHATALRQLTIDGADSLRIIENLPSITELTILNDSKLETISNLPMLKTMEVNNCHALRETMNLDVLDHLMLSDNNMEALPVWLEHITSLQRLDLACSVALLNRCSTDGRDWPMIRSIPRVEARSHDESKYISYTKNPLWFKSNLTGDGEAAALSLSPYYS